MPNFYNKLNKQEKSIWRYAKFYDKLIKPENRLILDNKKIPTSMTKIDSFKNIYFKREDENANGSLKDRSLAYQVSLAKQNRKKELAISTSGNAGISAAAYCKQAGIKLYVFISPETEKAKIAEMQKYNPVIIKSKRAIRLANYLSFKYKIENLRPSVNNSSIEGFKSIAFEIFEKSGEVDAIFTYVTSGSSFVGIARAYKYLLESGEIKKMPQLYAVQSGEIFSIAEEFENMASKEKSKAGKLGAKNTRRKNEIIEFIKSSGGKGVYVSEKEIDDAREILEKNKIYTSPEGCASFAGFIKKNKNGNFNKAVCVLSGKLRKETGKINCNLQVAENFNDVDAVMKNDFACC